MTSKFGFLLRKILHISRHVCKEILIVTFEKEYPESFREVEEGKNRHELTHKHSGDRSTEFAGGERRELGRQKVKL